MLGQSCGFDQKQHELLTNDILDWCHRQASDPETKTHLFMYRHRDEGTFVIGWWMDGDKGDFVDLLNIGYSLANFDDSMAEGFRKNLLCPLDPETTRRRIAQMHKDKISRLNDTNAERLEQLKRKHGEVLKDA